MSNRNLKLILLYGSWLSCRGLCVFYVVIVCEYYEHTRLQEYNIVYKVNIETPSYDCVRSTLSRSIDIAKYKQQQRQWLLIGKNVRIRNHRNYTAGLGKSIKISHIFVLCQRKRFIFHRMERDRNYWNVRRADLICYVHSRLSIRLLLPRHVL